MRTHGVRPQRWTSRMQVGWPPAVSANPPNVPREDMAGIPGHPSASFLQHEQSLTVLDEFEKIARCDTAVFIPLPIIKNAKTVDSLRQKIAKGFPAWRRPWVRRLNASRTGGAIVVPRTRFRAGEDDIRPACVLRSTLTKVTEDFRRVGQIQPTEEFRPRSIWTAEHYKLVDPT